MDKSIASEQPVEQKKIHFSKGLIGLEQYRDFILTELPDQNQFWLLQSVQDEHFGLVMTNPFWFMPDYDFELAEQEAKEIGEKQNLDVFVTVNVAAIPENITVNLMGPIIVDQYACKGLQILVSDKKYTTQHKLMSATSAGG